MTLRKNVLNVVPAFFVCLASSALSTPGMLQAAETPETSARQDLSWRRESGSLALCQGEQIVWQFNHGDGAGKPFFHPVAVAGGPTLTWDRPDDHPWHRAVWFSWKFINGVNYWEPVAATGDMAGQTTWQNVETETRVDFSVRISMDLAYRPAGGEIALTERRVIEISPPAKDGSYLMDWTMIFGARAEQVVLDRTPLPGEPGGQPWGGYAGLSVRLAEGFQNVRFTSPDGPIRFEGDTHRCKSSAMDCTGAVDEITAGIAILDHPGNVNSPTPWYLIRGNPMKYFSPAVIQDGPLTLKRNDRLTLKYRMAIHADRWSADQLEQAVADFVDERK